MEKHEVSVKVNLDILFNVYAENKEEAAKKAERAMNKIMKYNIDFDTEEENVEFIFGETEYPYKIEVV